MGEEELTSSPRTRPPPYPWTFSISDGRSLAERFILVDTRDAVIRSEWKSSLYWPVAAQRLEKWGRLVDHPSTALTHGPHTKRHNKPRGFATMGVSSRP